MTQQHLYLVDGSSFIFRAYHRLPPLTDPQGTPVGAVYGFTAMLWKLIAELNKAEAPTHLAVVLDAGSHTFRNDMYDGYKANRPPAPEDLIPQFPLIRDAVRAFSVPCFEQAGVEADDIIASYAVAARAAGMNVTIVSSDKDLMQLVEPGINMLDTMKNQTINRAEVIEKFGVPPEQVGEVLALMGDTADNIPGVKGVGPKTAAELISEYGSVEGVIANIAAIKKPKLKETLAASVDMARLSRELVRLKDDLPLPAPLDELTLKEPPHEPLAAFLKKHGFRAMLAKLGSSGSSGPAPNTHRPSTASVVEDEVAFVHADYETVTTLDRLDWWVAEIIKLGAVAVDTETTGTDQMRCDLVGISLSVCAGQGLLHPDRPRHWRRHVCRTATAAGPG